MFNRLLSGAYFYLNQINFTFVSEMSSSFYKNFRIQTKLISKVLYRLWFPPPKSFNLLDKLELRTETPMSWFFF